MDNGESFFDISEGFFGNDNDPGTSDFSWADEFISSSENQETNQTTASVLQQGIDEVITASSSLPVIASQNNSITTSQPSFILTNNTTGPVPLANQNAGIQFVQQQQTQSNQSQQIITSLPNLIGSTAQLVRGPNGQLILTSGPIQVQQSQQTLQPSSVQFSSQQFQTPSPSPIPASSPAVNRPITPASSSFITKSVGSIQYATSSDSTTISSSKVQTQPLVGNAGVNFLQIQGNAQQQILARNIQVQGQTSSGGINVQGQQILQNQGHVTYLQGHGQSAMLQGQQGATAVLQGQTAVLQGHNSQTALLQGQQGHTAMLHGQGQNIVNTQNTVIQNPNVVNLNVAHVLCNNPALQNQSGTVQQGQNIQGTLIQTADGKSIIIPSQLLQSGQPINLQNIQQVFQPQLNSSGANVVQGSSASGAGLIHGSAMLGNNVTLGGIGNVIRMATNTSMASQDKHLNAGLPVIGVNSQGQQVLIQRTQGQQQNIMVRALTPQTLQQLQQPSNNTSSTSNYHASQASQVMQQPLLVSSQPGIQLQRIITPTGHQVIAGQQNQAVKVIGQNPAGVLSINLPQNISFQNPQMQTVQLLQQQVQRAAMGVKSEPGTSSQAQQVVLGAGSDSKTLSFVTKMVSQQGTHVPNSMGLQNDATSSQPSVQNVFTSHMSVMPQYSVVNTIAPAATSQSQTALSQPIFSTTTQIPHVVPSVVTPQPSTDTKPPSFIQQTTLQARNNAPKLQTIQITPETQKKLQLIQTELKTLQSLKQLTNEQMQRQKKLIDVQKSIIQKCAQQQQQQAVLQAAQPMIGQPQAGFPATVNMVEIKKEEPQMVHPPMIGEPPTGTVPQQVTVVSSLAQGAIQANATLSNASPLLSALSSATTNIRPTVATTQNLILNQVTSAPTTLKIGQEATANPSVPKPMGTNLLPGTATLNSGTAQAPVPTQIKIANHVLQLNLTPDQKNKVEGYLARMTPEQQQQQIKLFLNLQRQQQLQAQVQAQKAHQAKLQQGKIPAPVQNLASGNASTAAGTGVPTGHMILPTGGPDNKLVAVANMPKEQLIHQQLSKDQENALRSDTHTPFHNQRDMTRRLLRYHVFQSAEPPKKLIKKDKDMFENCAEGLMRKSGAMFEKFRVLLMKESMRKHSTAETVMIQRLLNEDLKETITKEKKQLADDPGSFKPIPLHVLQNSEKAAAVKEEVKEKKPMVVKQEHPPEQVPPDSKSSSPFISIKEEESNSRPTTPKFRLIIRNDGQKLTSSTCITEDGDADSDTNTYIAEESSTDSYGDNNSDKGSVGSRSMFGNIESKAADDIMMDDNAASRWSDISNDEKPFSSYMETESAEASQMSYMNYPSNKMEMEETDSNAYPDQTEAVPSMISSDDTVNYSSQNTFHCSPPAISRSLSYTSDKALYRQDSSKNSNFSGSFSALEDSQKSLESSANSYTGSACAQYEPISSDEGDEEEGVTRFVPGKSEPYIISIGKHTMKYSGDSRSYLQSENLDKSNRTSSADVIEIADNDSNLKQESSSSSDSDSDSEASSLKDGENVTNYQMQSAIDSILQYDNATSPSSAYHHMDQSDFLNNDYEASQSEESAINSPQSYDRQDTGDHTDTTSMEDDLDAAVKSILM